MDGQEKVIDRAFQERVNTWADEMFPRLRVHSKMLKLAMETIELVGTETMRQALMQCSETRPGDVADEGPDIVMVLGHICADYGVDLATATHEKFEIVRRREYGPADSNGHRKRVGT